MYSSKELICDLVCLFILGLGHLDCLRIDPPPVWMFCSVQGTRFTFLDKKQSVEIKLLFRHHNQEVQLPHLIIYLSCTGYRQHFTLMLQLLLAKMFFWRHSLFFRELFFMFYFLHTLNFVHRLHQFMFLEPIQCLLTLSVTLNSFPTWSS